MTIAAFACTPTRSRISVAQCVRLYQLGREPKKTDPDRFRTTHCVGCVVGDAHTRDEQLETWPDGTPIARSELAAPTSAPPVPARRRGAVPLPTPRYARRPAPAATTQSPPETKNMAETRTITHAGETLSIHAWAKKLSLTDAGIRMRIKKGWTEAEAVSTPKGEPRPTRSARRASPKRRAAPRPPPVGGSTKRAARSSPAKRALVEPSEVAAMARDLGPAGLLARLGYTVEDLGEHPTGRVLVVREPAR